MVSQVKKAQQKPARPDLARVPKSVTLLGATGSIGSSTIDLLQREPGRYRIEAVTANRNAGASASHRLTRN
jgi:1-deoxy-D-xylulose-5-phosphate reductoisomerase